MNQHSFVVIMSVYSKERIEYLKSCILSLDNQTVDDFLVLIKVDGPISEEMSFFLNRLPTHKYKVYWRNENKGLAVSLNELIDEAKKIDGLKYIARMDSDDICLPSRFEKQIQYFERNKSVDILGGGCIEFNDEDGYKCEKLLDCEDHVLKNKIIRASPFIHPTVMFRSRVFEDGIRYPTDNYLSEDLYLWVYIAHQGLVFANIDEPLIHYRVSSDMYKRRTSFKKAVSEAKIKLHAMKLLKISTPKNYCYMLSYFILRCLPIPAVKFLYRIMR